MRNHKVLRFGFANELLNRNQCWNRREKINVELLSFL